MNVDLSTFKNPEYSHGAGTIKRVVWHIMSKLFIHSQILLPVSLKVSLLRIFGAKIGKGVVIKPNVNIKHPWFLEIGDYSWIGEEVWIDNLAKVKIGKSVCISQGAMLLTGNHDYSKSSFDMITGEIILEDGAWIGAKSVVCPGVIVGSNAVLAVMSVANKNLDPNGIYKGNPAEFIRIREFKI